MKDFEKYSCENVHFQPAPSKLVSLLNKKHKLNIADIGCGDGSILNDLFYKKLFKSAVAVDLSQTRLNRVKMFITDDSMSCICSDACDLSKLKSNSFDLVYSIQVIEHVSDDSKMLNEIFRILKPSGTLYISSIIKKKGGFYFYRCNNKWVCDPTHLREYSSKDEFVSLLKNNNFSVQEIFLSRFKVSLVSFFGRVLFKNKLISEKKLRSLNHGFLFSIPRYFTVEAVAFPNKRLNKIIKNNIIKNNTT